MTLHARMLLACVVMAAGACSDDDDGGESGAGSIESGSGGASGNGGSGGIMTGGTASMNGMAGTGGTGGTGATGGTSAESGGDAGMDSGEGGASGAGNGGGGGGGMNAGSGGDSDAGAMGGTSGSGSGGMLYENDCTLEVPWECKVCDAQETCAAATYVSNGDGTISSSCCGLVWQAEIEWIVDPEDPFDGCIDRPGAAGCYTFDEAQAYCATLDLAGGGWRVPVAVELQTLMVRDMGAPYIDRVAFPNAPTWDLYWTSSLSDRSDNEAWLGGFGGTFAGRRQKSQEHFVRCVRSE